MKTFASFYDAILPELPGCTPALVDIHLREVARDFCRRSLAWRQDLDPIVTVSGIAAYDLDAPELQTEVVKVLSMTMNGELLWSSQEPRRSRDGTESRPKYPVERPPFTISSDMTEIALVDEDPAGTIEMVGALQPSISATGLPDLLGTRHAEAMRAGTLSRLMVMPKKPWQDAALAAFYAMKYEEFITLAAANAHGGNVGHPLRVRKWG